MNVFEQTKKTGRKDDMYMIACPICKKEFVRHDMCFTQDCHGITYRLVCIGCYDKAMDKGYDGEYYTEADECIDEDY